MSARFLRADSSLGKVDIRSDWDGRLPGNTVSPCPAMGYVRLLIASVIRTHTATCDTSTTALDIYHTTTRRQLCWRRRALSLPGHWCVGDIAGRVSGPLRCLMGDDSAVLKSFTDDEIRIYQIFIAELTFGRLV